MAAKTRRGRRLERSARVEIALKNLLDAAGGDFERGGYCGADFCKKINKAMHQAQLVLQTTLTEPEEDTQ